MKDLEDAVGQFVLYEHALRREEPDRALYLAVPESAWRLIFADSLGEILIDDDVLRVVTFDPVKEEGVATQLVTAGVPRDRIVLAFKHPDLRGYTDFAAA